MKIDSTTSLCFNADPKKLISIEPGQTSSSFVSLFAVVLLFLWLWTSLVVILPTDLI